MAIDRNSLIIRWQIVSKVDALFSALSPEQQQAAKEHLAKIRTDIIDRLGELSESEQKALSRGFPGQTF